MTRGLRPGGTLLALLVVAGGACGAAGDPPVPPDPWQMDGGADAGAPADADTDAAGLPAAGASVQFGLQAAGQAATLPAAVAGISVESAVLALHELTLASDNGAMKIETERPLDLATGTVTLVLSPPRPGLYSRLVVKCEPAEEGRALAAFGGLRLSARVTGTLAAGVPFAINNATEFGIDLAVPAPFDLPPGGRLLARVRFDLAQWFAGITFPPSAEPVIIDGTHNPDLLARFRSNLVGSATLSFE
jgi:hypothetical protein